MSDPPTPNTPAAVDRSTPPTDHDPADAPSSPATALAAPGPEPSETRTAPSTAPPKPSWTDYDWVWNTLTLIFLVLSGSFMTNTAQAFSQGGWDILQTLGTVGQGAGLALVTGGALTSQGREALEKALNSLGIPPKYQAEVSCLFAGVTLGLSAAINTNLSRLGEYYYDQGLNLALQGRMGEAVDNFTEALNFLPNDARITVALGDFYEKGARHELALEFYSRAVGYGDPRALMGLGRIHLRAMPTLQGLQTAEIFLRLAQAQPKLDLELQSELFTAMGILHLRQAEILQDFPSLQDKKALKAALAQDQATNNELFLTYLPKSAVVRTEAMQRLLQQDDPIAYLYQEAQHNLEAAIAIDQKLADTPLTFKHPGYGMAYCYLGWMYDQQGNAAQSQKFWNTCAGTALPGSLEELAEVLSYGGGEIAGQLNTSKIVIKNMASE
ncbi:MAG: hypothetical protein VKK80_10180 [Prochlorothrix sp.]|nr:hypothetical protein [Prochlorothrix sp.]